MTYVNKGDFLRAVFSAWKEVPDDWTFAKLVANASTIAYGCEVDPKKVDDDKLISGFRALLEDPFEDDPTIIVDEYARAWERENIVFVEGV